MANPYMLWQTWQEVKIENPSSIEGVQASFSLPWYPGMRADFRDIRFADRFRNPLPYWIESKTDFVTAKVWVKLPANDKKILLYYGNGGVVSESNGDAVFELFDDFSGSSVDSEKWTARGNATIVDGELRAGGNSSYYNGLSSKMTFSRDFIIEKKIKISSDFYGDALFGIGSSYSFSSNFIGFYARAVEMMVYRNGNSYASFSNHPAAGDWHIYKSVFRDSNADFVYQSNAGEHIETETVSSTENNYHFQLFFGGTNALDWFRARKYTATEPTLTLSRKFPNFILSFIFSDEITKFFITKNILIREDIVKETENIINQLSKFKGENDLIFSKAYLTYNQIRILKEFADKENINVSEEFQSLNDLTGILDKNFKTLNLINTEKLLKESNQVIIHKIVRSINDIIITMIKDYYHSANNIKQNKDFHSKSDLLGLLQKEFDSASDVTVKQVYEAINKIFLSDKKVNIGEINQNDYLEAISDIRQNDYAKTNSLISVGTLSISSNNLSVLHLALSIANIINFKKFLQENLINSSLLIRSLSNIPTSDLIASLSDINLSFKGKVLSDISLSDLFGLKTDIELSTLLKNIDNLNLSIKGKTITEISLIELYENLSNIKEKSLFETKNAVYLGQIFNSLNSIEGYFFKNFKALSDIRQESLFRTLEDIKLNANQKGIGDIRVKKLFDTKKDILLFPLYEVSNQIDLSNKFIEANYINQSKKFNDSGTLYFIEYFENSNTIIEISVSGGITYPTSIILTARVSSVIFTEKTLSIGEIVTK